MSYLSKRDFLEFIESFPEESIFAILSGCSDDGGSLYFDVDYGVSDCIISDVPVIYLYSEGLDLTIKGEKELLKSEKNIFF